MKRLFLVLAATHLPLFALVAACDDGPDIRTVTFATSIDVPDARWIDEPLPPPPPLDAGPPDACPRAIVEDAGSWMPHKPPRDGTAACETGQTTTIISACEFQEGECANFPVPMIPCLNCLYVRDTEATYGFKVYVRSPNVERVNFRGYALRAGAPEACGNAIEAYVACLEAACTCVSGTRKPTCFKRAKGGACKATSDAIATACQSHAAAAFLVPIIEANQFDEKVDAVTIAKAMCGGT